MTVIALVPALVALFGAGLYVLSSKVEVKEMGRIAFACGLLVFVYSMTNHTVRLP